MTAIADWTPEVWVLLSPLWIVCLTAVVILALDLVVGARRVQWSVPALVGLAFAAAASLARWQQPLPEVERVLGGAVRLDNLSVFLYLAIIGCTALCLLAAASYPENDLRRRAEFYVLALFSATGMMLLVSSGDLITMFLGLELLSFPIYVLCGYRRADIKSNEAALKYFILGSFASSLFLYGVALLWGATQTTSIAGLRAAPGGPLFHLGALLVLIGFLFKIGAAPFHMWVPDVYEGAPTPVSAFMVSGVKVAAFGAFVRVLLGAFGRDDMPYETVLWWLACITMIVGNLSALTQENVKRMLAFSSVAHAGYMLVGLAAWAASPGDSGGAVAVLFYLLAYAAMNIGAFTVVALLARRAEGDLVFERDWGGVARRHPFLGLAMAVFMLGLGGIPPTSGFFGKYSLFKSAIDAGLVGLVVVAVANSLVSVYYYLRVVVAMYMKPERRAEPGILESLRAGRAYALEGPGAMAAGSAEPEAAALAASRPRLAEGGGWPAKLVVLVCLLATLWLGFGPSGGGLPGVSRLLQWAGQAIASLH